MSINPISGYIIQSNKYAYELSNTVTKNKCRCGLCSDTIKVFPDGKEIAMHVTLKGCYFHIFTPGQKIRRVFKRPKEF